MKKGYRFAFTLVVLASLAAISSIAHAGIPLGPDRFLIQNDGGVSHPVARCSVPPFASPRRVRARAPTSPTALRLRSIWSSGTTV
jgi:hypothetical protein